MILAMLCLINASRLSRGEWAKRFSNSGWSNSAMRYGNGKCHDWDVHTYDP